MSSPSTIAGRVAAMHATRAATASGNVTSAFSREQAELAGGGLPAGLAAAGTVLPDTGLLDPCAAATTLYAITGDSTTVLIFYQGALCPYCNNRPVRLSGGPAPTAHRTWRPAGRDQPPEARRIADHAAEAQPGLRPRATSSRAGSAFSPSRPRGPSRPASAGTEADQRQRRRHRHAAGARRRHPGRRSHRTVFDVHPDYTSRTEPQQILDALDQISG
jgi:hypothetical protein